MREISPRLFRSLVNDGAVDDDYDLTAYAVLIELLPLIKIRIYSHVLHPRLYSSLP